MIGSLIGAGLSAAGSIFGGIRASKAMKKAKKRVEARKKENRSWYNRNYNEDATQRADAQRLLNMTEERIRDRNREAAGAQAVAGGTEESVAATKAANAGATADVAARIAAAGEARKDRVEQEYRRKDEELDDRLSQIEAGKAAALSDAVGGVASAGGELAGAFGEDLDNIFSRAGKAAGGARKMGMSIGKTASGVLKGNL